MLQGGLCFSELSPKNGGDIFWGFKTVNFSNGQTEIIVPFDDEFTNATKETLNAEVLDENAQWQPNWWKYSEKQGDKGTDVVVNYSTVTLVYEYDNTQPTEPTDPIEKIKGDVNADGEFTVADLIMMQKFLLLL